MEPDERAYAVAVHRFCEDGEPHDVSAHEPFDVDDSDYSWADWRAMLEAGGWTYTGPQPPVEDRA